MKTETLIELQRSITQGEWIPFAAQVCLKAGSGHTHIADCFAANNPNVSATDTQLDNARAIALVPELIAEVIRLRELANDANQQLAKMDFNSSANWNGALKTNVALLLDAALANDK